MTRILILVQYKTISPSNHLPVQINKTNYAIEQFIIFYMMLQFPINFFMFFSFTGFVRYVTSMMKGILTLPRPGHIL